MQPYNYQIDVPNPAQMISQAVGTVQGVDQFKQQRAATLAAQEQQKALQTDLVKLSQSPTASNVAQLMVKYPQMGEQFKRTYDVLSKEEQTARVGEASEVYAALQADEPEIAASKLQEYATAYRNSGQEKNAKVLDDLAEVVKLSPESAKTNVALFLASAMGPDKFTETFTKLETDRRRQALEGSTLTAAQASAHKAAVDSKFAESQAVADLEKKGWDIFKIQEDTKVAKENSRIAALRADLARETNDLKRQQMEVKLSDMERKRDEEVNAKVADVEGARSNIDNMMGTLDKILQTPLNVVGNATGPVDQWTPTIRQSTADFQELISNVDAQAFLAQIPNIKGMGALSDAEGKKLAAALQNFSLRQSPEQLLGNAKEAQRLMLKARKNLAERYGVPDNIPDTPAAQPTGDDIDSLIQQYAPGVP